MYYVDTCNTQINTLAPVREALLDKVLAPAPVFTIHRQSDADRAEVEAFVADKFYEAFGAQIHEYMPALLSMRCMNGFSGVIGMRKAATSPLFLERYLDADIETVMAQRLGQDIERREIIEIGNLVAGRKGPSQFVFLVAMTALYDAGYRWITFTATRSLANNLDKLGFPMTVLADASVECLDQIEAQEWGTYYASKPQVYAGSLEDAMAIARKRPLFRRAMAMYRRRIRDISRQISGI